MKDKGQGAGRSLTPGKGGREGEASDRERSDHSAVLRTLNQLEEAVSHTLGARLCQAQPLAPPEP